MTGYSGIILFVVSFYATITFFLLFSASRRIFHFSLGITGVFLSIIGISNHIAHFFPVLNPDFIDEWASVFGVSFLLSAAAALIRDFKPAFSRFPKAFAFFPLVLIVVYPLILETVIVKNWAIAIYQGGSLFIGLLIYSYKAQQNGKFAYVVVGLIFLLITFILFWLPDTVFYLPVYVWILLLACGILIITVGYSLISSLEEQYVEEKEKTDRWFV